MSQKKLNVLISLKPSTLLTSAMCALLSMPLTSVGANARNDWVERTLRGLSVEQKIGQMLQIRVYAQNANTNDPEYVSTRNTIQKYHIGSVDLGAHLLGPNLIKGSPRTVATVLNQIQQDSELPLLVGADIERGVASRVANTPDFPLAMAFGATGDANTAKELGRITAEEARAIGIHWAYAPVADVSENPDDQVIANRSFGQSPDLVGAFVSAFTKGAHEWGLLVTAKHFPGQGESSMDSHVSIDSLDGDMEHLRSVHLRPFQDAIAAGIDAVLVGHTRVPALDPDPNRIATTSPKIIDGYLRKQLGFQGLVITDALEMRGLTLLYPGNQSPTAQAAVDAVKAGADVIMLPTDLDGAFHALVNAVRSGDISENRIDESVRRILEAKAALGLDRRRTVDPTEAERISADPEAQKLAQTVADHSVTLVKNEGSLLPLRRTDPKASDGGHQVVLILSDSARGPLGHEFERGIKERRPDAQIFHSYYDNLGSDAEQQVLREVDKADVVLVAAFVTHLPGKQRVIRGQVRNVIGLGGASEELFRSVLNAGGKKVLVIALGNPYLISRYPEISNYVCTYSVTSTSEISAVKALFGEIQNHAHLPITIPKIGQPGFSIPWPVAAKGQMSRAH